MTPQANFIKWASSLSLSGENGYHLSQQSIDGKPLEMELWYVADIESRTHFPGDYESPPEDDDRCLSVKIEEYSIIYDDESFEITDGELHEIEQKLKEGWE